MIRFSCPVCQQVLEARDEGAGQKMHCPKCGQKLLVPPPAQVRNKTVLGQLLPDRAPQPAEEQVDLPAELSPEPEPFGTSEWESPPQPSKAGPLVVSLFIVAVLVLVVLFGMALKSRNGKRGNELGLKQPAAKSPGPRMPDEHQDDDQDPGNDEERRTRNEELERALEELNRKHKNRDTAVFIVPEPRPNPLPPFSPPEEDQTEPPGKIGEDRPKEHAQVADHGKAVKSTASKPASGKSVEDCSRRIAASPDDAGAYYDRGNAYLAKSKYDQAINDYNQAIQLDPRLSNAYAKREAAYGGLLKATPVPGYSLQKIHGFQVLVNKSVLLHSNDPAFLRKPLDVLKLELGTVVKVLPRQIVRPVQSVLIWVEWQDDTDPDTARGIIGKYYGGGGSRIAWALGNNKQPLKMNSVEIINMRALTTEHQPSQPFQRCALLHELAHAVHFQLFGANNLQIKAAFQQAVDRGLYENSIDAYGRPMKPYARTSDFEYFAELTCAYFNTLHYRPFTRKQLQKHDPVGYRVMELTWGKTK